MSIHLEPEQEEAAARMIEAAEDGEDFALDGLAGTGKTTVLGVVASELGNAKLVAPTGKAASVLARKTGIQATTIHRAIYYPPTEVIDPVTGKRRLVWERRREPGSLCGTTFLIDEASMVNTVLAREMLDTGANLIGVFDSGQLPPVEGTPFFTEADFTLHQVHRQALESPIIRQAHAVRRGGRYQPDGDAFRVVAAIDALAADVVIALKNTTRDHGNQMYRARAGLTSPLPVKGELIVCLLNAYDFGIYNGAIYTVARDLGAADRTIAIVDDGNTIEVPCAFVPTYGGREWNPRAFLPRIPFAFGYAITGHKSQGSEWQRVAVWDECWPGYQDRWKWLYTALTRASDTVEVCRYRGRQ